ncbi:peroxidase-like protein [Mytilus californianus]|uniref:peroxidase-like protein n=1 Tax=Mytilus californianus TaxID=6549 RepID=UPI00224557B0|nr:peroxidase-like protein [Mytilus californianus]
MDTLTPESTTSSRFSQIVAPFCAAKNVTCDPYEKYRSYDGKCNNLGNPLWGSALTAQPRFISATYGDRYNSGSEPRKNSVRYGSLPNPRDISNTVHKEGTTFARGCLSNVAFTHFGQFIDHDVVSTPIKKSKKGDIRHTEVPMLNAIHTLFLREHNRIVGILKKINPHHDGLRLYNEARKILIGVYQHIIYKEFIPKLLGTTLAHPFVASAVRNHLFETKPGNGFDLSALNIQRGRDHGLPSYNKFRKFCGLQPALTFGYNAIGLRDMSYESAGALQRMYRHPDDIDLFSGGLSETPVQGGLVGPTFGCLIALQFEYYRNGDRFFYENAFSKTGFTSVLFH